MQPAAVRLQGEGPREEPVDRLRFLRSNKSGKVKI